MFGCSILLCKVLSAQHFATVKTSEGIELSENGKKILFYQQYPKMAYNKYNRAGYAHPLYNLDDGFKIGGADDAKGYGGFCVRLKLPADITFISNDSTVTPMETAVSAGSWMDIQGSLSGDSLPKSGIAIFPNPSNPGTNGQ